MTATPGFEPFPPDTGTDDGELYVHSVTGDDYIYDKDKGCWRVISAVKQRVFAQALPPDIPTNGGATPGYVPTRGDMWWDSNLLELRVWNQPDPEDPNDTVPTPGRWISSTNPHMSPLSPSKNLVIGQLSILDQDGQPFKAKVLYEDTLYTLQIKRTDSNASEKLIKYGWRSIPETIAGNPVKFSSPTGTLTKVEIPPLGRDASGNIIPQSVRIYCKVTAIDKVDTFIEPVKEVNTGVLPIREIPVSGVPITANTKALLLSESEVGIGTDTIGKYLVYEINAAELDFDGDYSNARDDYPHEDTYVIQKAQLSSTVETSTVEFIYENDDTMNNYRLSFWEDKERTVPWGTSPDTGANLGVINITEACDGSEAIIKLGEQPFDLVVTDYNMPEVNGLELTEHIRQSDSYSHLPVMMVTSEANDAHLSHVAQSGVNAIADKPFEPEFVKRILGRLLEGDTEDY